MKHLKEVANDKHVETGWKRSVLYRSLLGRDQEHHTFIKSHIHKIFFFCCFYTDWQLSLQPKQTEPQSLFEQN